MNFKLLLMSGATGLLLLSGCHGEPPKPKDDRVPVEVAAASVKNVPVQLRAIGSVQPLSNVAVKSLVSGNLERVWFREGEDVRRGQLLFTIDRRPYQATLAQAQANLARDEATLRNAESEAARYGGLVKKDYVTREEAEKYATSAAAARAVVAADRAEIQSARLQLSYCEIHSPLDGRTGSLLVHAGNNVRANDVSPLVVINQVRPIYVQFSVPESQLPVLRGRMARGRVAAVVSPHAGGAAIATGALSFVDNAVDTSTGTIVLRATFDNASGALWPGQYVSVAVTLEDLTGAVVVPSRAVQSSQNGQYVYIVKADNSVEMRPVVVAQNVDQESVIGRGLTGGETVITDGHLRVTPKSHVEIKSAL